MKLVAFYSSCSGTGKTTSAKAMSKFFNRFDEDGGERLWQCYVKSFAGEVKEDVYRLAYAFPGKPKWKTKDEIIPGIGKSERQFLIDYGMFCREKIHPDYWIWRLEVELRGMAPLQKPIFIDDLRFPNEYAWLRKNNALIIRLTTERKLIKHGADGLLDSFSFDSVINTDKEKKEFDRELTEVIYQYLKD